MVVKGDKEVSRTGCECDVGLHGKKNRRRKDDSMLLSLFFSTVGRQVPSVTAFQFSMLLFPPDPATISSHNLPRGVALLSRFSRSTHQECGALAIVSLAGPFAVRAAAQIGAT